MKYIILILFCITFSILTVIFLQRTTVNIDSISFSKGESRHAIYEKMGNPSNNDDKIVAVWSVNSANTNWRQIIGESNDVYIAIFDEDNNAVLSKRSVSQIRMSINASDAEIREVNQ